MIYIVVRKTLNWGYKEAFLAQLPERLREGVALWDSTFSMPFHIFRRELKRIASLNHAAVENVNRIPLEDVPPAALRWCEPYLEQMRELHEALRPIGERI